MSTTLVVVDMQPGFTSSLVPSLVKSVANEISLAKKRKAGIIFLEYEGSCKTHRVLEKMIDDYPHFARSTKNRDDGSHQVQKALGIRSFDSKNIRVCGVNSCYCVKGTVYGLLHLLEDSNVEVATYACNCICGNVCWKRYVDHQRLKLLKLEGMEWQRSSKLP